MAKFAYLYTGGTMAATPQERDQKMQAWGVWFGQLDTALVDGGSPFASSAAVAADGAVHDVAPSRISGYTLIEAPSLAEATTLAKGCPVLSSGGSVEVYEAIEM